MTPRWIDGLLARFYLRPDERVRLPRVLVLLHEGEPRESNARFRRLLGMHYMGILPRPLPNEGVLTP